MASSPSRFAKWMQAMAFMSPRDIGLFLRSARTDTAIARLRTTLGQQGALDAVYGAGDPWASADPRYVYQHRKYDVLIGLLAGHRFGNAVDIGSGLGHFTRKLAVHCDLVLGIDISGAAVGKAAALHSDIPNLAFQQGNIMTMPPMLDGTFDLVTIVDSIYYLPPPIDDDLLDAIAVRMARMLKPGGQILLCNHFFFSADRDSRLSRRIHQTFSSSSSLDVVSEHRRPFYLATILRRAKDSPAHPGTLAQPAL